MANKISLWFLLAVMIFVNNLLWYGYYRDAKFEARWNAVTADVLSKEMSLCREWGIKK